MTLTPIAGRLAVEPITTCFYDLGLSRLGFEHPTFRLRGQRSNPLRHRRGYTLLKYHYMDYYYFVELVIVNIFFSSFLVCTQQEIL